MKPYMIVVIIILIIGLGIGVYFLIKKSGKKEPVQQNTPALQSGSQENIPKESELTQEFKNDDLKLSLKYPKNWQTKDLGGDKNVKEPLVRENIFFAYDPVNSQSDSSQANLKVLRFVPEPDKKINSQDDWYNYIKGKVDDYISNAEVVGETGYKFISLDKVEDINGHYTVREDYNLKDNVRGRDYYIYAQDIYQFIFECVENNFNSYSPIFEQIVKSFSVSS